MLFRARCSLVSAPYKKETIVMRTSARTRPPVCKHRANTPTLIIDARSCPTIKHIMNIRPSLRGRSLVSKKMIIRALAHTSRMTILLPPTWPTSGPFLKRDLRYRPRRQKEELRVLRAWSAHLPGSSILSKRFHQRVASSLNSPRVRMLSHASKQ